MTDITTIPMEELLEDRAASEMDALVWKKLGGNDERVRINLDIVAKINAEIERRNNVK